MSAYFDGVYFDPAYFDTAAAPVASEASTGWYRRPEKVRLKKRDAPPVTAGVAASFGFSVSITATVDDSELVLSLLT